MHPLLKTARLRRTPDFFAIFSREWMAAANLLGLLDFRRSASPEHHGSGTRRQSIASTVDYNVGIYYLSDVSKVNEQNIFVPGISKASKQVYHSVP